MSRDWNNGKSCLARSFDRFLCLPIAFTSSHRIPFSRRFSHSATSGTHSAKWICGTIGGKWCCVLDDGKRFTCGKRRCCESAVHFRYEICRPRNLLARLIPDPYPDVYETYEKSVVQADMWSCRSSGGFVAVHRLGPDRAHASGSQSTASLDRSVYDFFLFGIGFSD